jgi:DNA-directed RNA polymerase subunit E'/Rpb7
MENLYTTNILENRFHLEANEFGQDPDEIFIKKLKKEIEGRCIREGYVKSGSVKILSRSLGKINQAYFTGLPVYDIKYQAEVCNPPLGSILECIVKDQTKMGLVCQVDDTDNPLDIVVPSQWHFNNKKYTMLQPEMKIKVKVARKRHDNGDNTIAVVASLVSTPFDSDKSLDESGTGTGNEIKSSKESDNESESEGEDDDESDDDSDN